VTVTHANLLSAAETVIDYLGIVGTDRIASALPFSFVYGMSQVLCAAGSGATLVVERSPLAAQLVADLRAQAITVLAGVPPLWQQLLNVAAFRDEPIPSLRIATNAGGHLPVPVVRALRRAQPQARLFLMYGLTEVLRSTFLPPEEVDRRPDSMGRAPSAKSASWCIAGRRSRSATGTMSRRRPVCFALIPSGPRAPRTPSAWCSPGIWCARTPTGGCTSWAAVIA